MSYFFYKLILYALSLSKFFLSLHLIILKKNYFDINSLNFYKKKKLPIFEHKYIYLIGLTNEEFFFDVSIRTSLYIFIHQFTRINNQLVYNKVATDKPIESFNKLEFLSLSRYNLAIFLKKSIQSFFVKKFRSNFIEFSLSLSYFLRNYFRINCLNVYQNFFIKKNKKTFNFITLNKFFHL